MIENATVVVSEAIATTTTAEAVTVIALTRMEACIVTVTIDK